MKINGAQLKALRESSGKTLDETADILGLEPHVLSGVEAGWRGLTMHQWSVVLKRLEAMKPPAIPGAARLPVGPDDDDDEGAGDGEPMPPTPEACVPKPGLAVGSPDTDLHHNEDADSRG